MQGSAVIASQFLPAGGRGTAPDIKPTPYDPAQAKALLAQAGYPNGFRVVLHGPNDRYINDAKIVQAVAQMFTRIGIDTSAVVMPWAGLCVQDWRQQFQHHAVQLGREYGRDVEPALCPGGHAKTNRPGLVRRNEGRYSNPAMDAKLKQATATMDDATRDGLLGECCSMVFQDTAILPLHHEVSVWAARKSLTYANPGRSVHAGRRRRPGLSPLFHPQGMCDHG